MIEILTRIVNNEGSVEDLDLLDELSCTITETALCGLGQAACNPVVSTLKYFRNEYLAHVVDHHCPICNGRRRRLLIKPELCKGCGKCKRNCSMEPRNGMRIRTNSAWLLKHRCVSHRRDHGEKPDRRGVARDP